MAISGYPIPVTEHTVRANGIDVWYVEAGEGLPLLLLHGGAMSNGPLRPNGWGAYLDLFAPHYRVLLPDTRGHGRTRNPSGQMSYPLFAQDVVALIAALGLDHPFVGGFSDGGAIASLVGILAPDVPRALIDWSGLGFELLNPDPYAWPYSVMREDIGGSPDAVQVDYDGLASRGFNLQRIIDDYEPAQGRGYVRTYFEQMFRVWTRPEDAFADYARISCPILMIFGDRDPECRVPRASEMLSQLPHGELGIIPGVGHQLARMGCLMTLDFLQRHSTPAP